MRERDEVFKGGGGGERGRLRERYFPVRLQRGGMGGSWVKITSFDITCTGSRSRRERERERETGESRSQG